MLKKSCFCLFVIFILTISVDIHSTQAKSKADKERRSSIHQIDGYVYLSEDKTIEQMRKEAFALAKRQALEAAQTYIQSKTEVENFTLSFDKIWSEAEGVVRVLEQKDHGIVENSRYHVWIKAEVRYSLEPKTPPKTGGSVSNNAQLASHNNPGPLTVDVWTKEKKYTQGDEVVVYLRGNRDFFAVVVDLMSNGEIIQLLPNVHRKNNFFKAGVKYRIPGPDDRFSLAVNPPYGQDRIVVYASEAFMDGLPTQRLNCSDCGIGRFLGSDEDLSIKARGLSVEANEKKHPNQGVEFFEARWSFSTAPN